MNTYRVWYENGSAVLVNADNPKEAQRLAHDLWDQQQRKGSWDISRITRIERLS